MPTRHFESGEEHGDEDGFDFVITGYFLVVLGKRICYWYSNGEASGLH